MRKDGAPGLSGVTAKDYGRNLEANLTDLLLSLGLFHRRFLTMNRSRNRARSHIERTGGIALDDGANRENHDIRLRV